MAAWVNYMKNRAGDDLLWIGDFHYGDWLAFATTRSDYPGATTEKDLIATAYFSYSSGLLAKIAKVLGKTADAAMYSDLSERVKQAFINEYVTPSGRLVSHTQTAYSLALAFDPVSYTHLLYLNGEKVGNELFTPGWTSYNKRIQYQTYDVTNKLKERNSLGAILGDGWYRGNIGFSKQHSYYGDKLALIAQLRITYTDGTNETIGTDESWKATTGPLIFSDIYNGDCLLYTSRCV